MKKINLEKILKNLREMRLTVMASHLLMMMESNELDSLSIEELLMRISEEELTSRKNNTISRYKKMAKLSQKSARLEEINYSVERNINKSVIDQLQSGDYIMKHRNVIIMGACGTGKSYIANALGNNSCENFYSTYYCRLFEFLEECNQSIISDDSCSITINKYRKYDVLIIDDFLIQELIARDVHHLFRLMEYRYGNKSTIVCSQLAPGEWHERLGGNLVADSVIDRILPNAYQIILSGKSLRSI